MSVGAGGASFRSRTMSSLSKGSLVGFAGEGVVGLIYLLVLGLGLEGL